MQRDVIVLAEMPSATRPVATWSSPRSTAAQAASGRTSEGRASGRLRRAAWKCDIVIGPRAPHDGDPQSRENTGPADETPPSADERENSRDEPKTRADPTPVGSARPTNRAATRP